MVFILGILAGVTITIARILNSNLADKLGLLEGTFYNFLVGLLTSILFLLFTKELPLLSTISFFNIPLFAYIGGGIGVLVIFLSNYVTPKISVFYATIIIFVGQLFTGILIDYITLDMIPKGKIIGGLFVLIGLIINILIDKKDFNSI